MILHHYIDYDRPHLPGLSYAERVSYLEARLQKILIKPLDEMLNRIKYDPKEHSPILIYANAICCSIESMGRFLNGSMLTKSGPVFKGWIDRYMHPDFMSQSFNGELYVDILWKYYRNGLAHCFYIKHGGFEVQHTNPVYFKQHNDQMTPMLEIEPEMFLNDFKAGIATHLSDLRAVAPPDPLANNFMQIFNGVYIQGN